MSPRPTLKGSVESMKILRLLCLSILVDVNHYGVLSFGISTVHTTAIKSNIRIHPPMVHSSVHKKYRSRQLSTAHEDDEIDRKTVTAKDSNLQILNAAFLVAGTTIGGGFLALPSVVAPSGFYPSAVALIGVWGYFLAQSFVLVECINRTKYDSNDSNPPGVAGAAKSVFGKKGEIAIGILLVILIEATLVSQISRAGMLFPNYRLGCVVSAVSIATLVFGPKSGIIFASKANAALTSLFLLSTLSVFGCGVGIADWSKLGMSNNWASVPAALPSFLQLLVYGEIVPTVCQILKYNTRRIKMAIILGSFMTLCLQIGWSGLGLSLVSSASDAVEVLLASSGPVRLPLFSLAITAILTTILGSYLALLSTVNDFVQKSRKKDINHDDGEVSDSSMQKSQGDNSPWHRMKVASIITVPASLIACSSPSVFLKAIDFAGSYPVLMLWGVAPPLMALIQRSRDDKGTSNFRRTAGPSVWLVVLALLAIGMIGFSAIGDMASFVNKFKIL